MLERIKQFFKRNNDPDEKMHREFELTKKRINKLYYKRNYIRAVLYKHPDPKDRLLAEEVFALAEELLNIKDYCQVKNDVSVRNKLISFSEKLNRLKEIIGYE